MDLQRAWLRRGWAARLLWPVSMLFGAIVAVRRSLFRVGLLKVDAVGVPVVVIGNVVAGGAGKTPAVIAVVRHLQARGWQVGMVSRGYGRRTRDCRLVDESSDPRDVGDEPALIRRATGAPVAVARRRIEAARALVRRHPGTRVIVSDDGLQHLALARQIEVCVFDDRGVGNGWLLPAGPLREPWPRACDLVLHSGSHPAFEGFRASRRLADDVLHSDGRTTPLASLAGRPMVAVAGIAKPQAFFDMLEARGIVLDARIALSDHHDFAGWQPPPGSAGRLLCTEKDAIKLWREHPDALAVPLEFAPAAAFFAALDAKLSSADGHQAA